MNKEKERLSINMTINCLVEAKFASKSHFYQAHLLTQCFAEDNNWNKKLNF